MILKIIAIIYVLSLLFLHYMYKFFQKYYKLLIIKDPKTGKEINIHDKYDAFRLYDPIIYWPYILIGTPLFPIRAILCFLDCVFFLWNLKFVKLFYKHTDSNPKEAKAISNICKFWSTLFLKICNIKLKEEIIDCKEIYKKYLGPDYNFDVQKHSIIICNHLGYYDVIANMSINGAGFIAMQEVGNAPIGGDIAKNIGSIFVERTNEESRKKSLEGLLKREQDFYDGKNFNELVIFPEGTTTNNRYLIKFKKGAFMQLLPVKPMLMKIDFNSPCHLCCGVAHLFFHVMRSFCYLSNSITFTHMPVIKPTEFMYKNFSNLGKDKWEIYANVVNKIYLEVGKFKESDIGLRDKKIYYEVLETGKFPDFIEKKEN